MTISVTCQKCHARIRVGDQKAGKRIKCPKCETVLRVPASDEFEDEDEFEEAPPKQRRRSAAQNRGSARKRNSAKKAKSSKTPLLIAVGVVVASVAIGIVLLRDNDNPQGEQLANVSSNESDAKETNAANNSQPSQLPTSETPANTPRVDSTATTTSRQPVESDTVSEKQTPANNGAEKTAPVIPASASTEVSKPDSSTDIGSATKSGSGDGTPSYKQLHQIKPHGSTVYSVAISPNGKTIVSGGAEKAIKIWNAESFELIRELDGHNEHVGTVTISKDGKRILSGSWDKTMRMWDLETGRPLRTFLGHKWPVLTTAISPDGKRALSGSDGFRHWDLATGRILGHFKGHKGVVWSVAFSSCGHFALTCGGDRTVRFWDLRSRKEVKRLVGHTGTVKCARLSPDDQFAVSCSTNDPNVRLWSLTTGKQVRVFPHRAPVASIDFSPDGRWLLCALGEQDSEGKFVKPTGARGIRVWDLSKESNEPLIQINDTVGPVQSIAFMPNGTRAISGSGDGSLHVWSLLNLPSVSNPASPE